MSAGTHSHTVNFSNRREDKQMAFEQVQDLNCDTTISLGGTNKKTGKPNPRKVEGYYLGYRQVDSPKSKSGKANLYVFQTHDGTLGVWGKTDLDHKMGSVKPGTMTRVTQTGMKPTKNGDMYAFKVEVDKANTIDVDLDSGSGSEDSGYEAASDDVAAYEDDTDVDADEAQADELPPASRPAAARTAAAASAPSADRQAKVQALLNSRRSAAKA